MHDFSIILTSDSLYHQNIYWFDFTDSNFTCYYHIVGEIVVPIYSHFVVGASLANSITGPCCYLTYVFQLFISARNVDKCRVKIQSR